MSTVHANRSPVQVPRDADGYLVPRLLPVAAYLCAEGYSDPARSAALEALAAGRRPIVCALLGLIGWQDVAPIEEILERRPPYPGRIAPVCGGAPAPAAAGWPAWTDADRWVPTGPYRPTEEDGRRLAAQHGDQADAGDFPRKYTAAEYRAALRELVADYLAE